MTSLPWQPISVSPLNTHTHTHTPYCLASHNRGKDEKVVWETKHLKRSGIKPSSTPSRETNKRTIQRSGPLWEHPPHSTGVSWQGRNVLVCTLCRRRRLTATLRSNTEGKNAWHRCSTLFWALLNIYERLRQRLSHLEYFHVNTQTSCARFVTYR